MNVLSFSKVWKRFNAEAPALADVTVTVAEGEFAALAGPSGSGKSTLLNLSAGLDVPSEGQVLLLGRDLKELGPEKLAILRSRCLGFVFQAYNLIPVLTVEENVEFPLALQGAGNRRQAIRDALKAVGVEDLARRYPRELSGGQQQRVAVARAIVHRPKLVLGDEPTANLDKNNVELMMELFANLNQQLGITFLLTSHDPRVLARTPRIIELADGKLVQSDRGRNETESSHPHRGTDSSTEPDAYAPSLCERVV